MEQFNIDMSNLDDAQKQAMAKEMFKIVVAKMNPRQKKRFFSNMKKVAYKVELQKKFMKHKRAIQILTISLMPIFYLIAILRVMLLKKLYLRQAWIVAQNFKRLREMTSSKCMNLISPERTPIIKQTKTQEDYAS
jgi:hypothetical protein